MSPMRQSQIKSPSAIRRMLLLLENRDLGFYIMDRFEIDTKGTQVCIMLGCILAQYLEKPVQILNSKNIICFIKIKLLFHMVVDQLYNYQL